MARLPSLYMVCSTDFVWRIADLRKGLPENLSFWRKLRIQTGHVLGSHEKKCRNLTQWIEKQAIQRRYYLRHPISTTCSQPGNFQSSQWSIYFEIVIWLPSIHCSLQSRMAHHKLWMVWRLCYAMYVSSQNNALEASNRVIKP